MNTFFDVLLEDPAIVAARARVQYVTHVCGAPLRKRDDPTGEARCRNTVVNVDAGVGGVHADKKYCSPACTKLASRERTGSQGHEARDRRRAAGRAARAAEAALRAAADKRDRDCDVRDLAAFVVEQAERAERAKVDEALAALHARRPVTPTSKAPSTGGRSQRGRLAARTAADLQW